MNAETAGKITIYGLMLLLALVLTIGWIVNWRTPKCETCGRRLNRRYWKAQEGQAYGNLLRQVCELRKRCIECGVKEERMGMGRGRV